MSNKFEFYCKIDFLLSLYGYIDQSIESFISKESSDKYYYSLLYRLIHNHSDIIVDVTKEELLAIATDEKNKRYNPNFKKFIKSEIDTIVSYPETFEQMEHDDDYFSGINPRALFFLDKSIVECEQMSQKYGMIFISKDDILLNLHFLFDSDVQPITKSGNIDDWEFIQKYKHPCNSIIIADNYLLKENIEENIIAFLKYLLPDSLDINFHLTLIAGGDKSDSSFDIEKRYETIINSLQGDYDYNINLTILKTKENHDRNLLTNYFWINSGYGFSLFKEKKVKNETNLFCFPIFTLQANYSGFGKMLKDSDISKNRIATSVASLIGKYKKINSSTVDIALEKNVKGDKRNRLLD
jgi:hypothetical protein